MAIIGVGNCASSLVQGVEFYKDAAENEKVPGLMHVNLGGYHIRDIEFTAAFDIDRNKVGKDLSAAVFTEPNNTFRFSRVPNLNVPVYRGMTHDRLGKYLSLKIDKADGPTADIVNILKKTRTHHDAREQTEAFIRGENVGAKAPPSAASSQPPFSTNDETEEAPSSVPADAAR